MSGRKIDNSSVSHFSATSSSVELFDGIATPSSRHRAHGVEDNATIQHERARKKFDFHTGAVRRRRRQALRLRAHHALPAGRDGAAGRVWSAGVLKSTSSC